VSNPVSPMENQESALVLIVEDEEPLAETLAFAVQAAGYTALVALNGREALNLARTRRPALLIADLMLPHLDGAALIATLRAHAVANGTGRLPTILVTAANPVQARAAGADVVLRKPFHLKDLQALLYRFLGPGGPSTDGNAQRSQG
jgi:DNA-binding response OmpR family regulator